MLCAACHAPALNTRVTSVLAGLQQQRGGGTAQRLLGLPWPNAAPEHPARHADSAACWQQ
jgi:hypothetical protein